MTGSHRRGSRFAKFPRQLLFAVLLLPSLSRAQEESPATSTITVQTRVVAVDAVVRNADGEPVLNLDKNAFTLKVAGKLVDIRYFNRDNDLPLTVCLMIDTSGSQRVYFSEEELSSDTFFTNILTHPNDRALIVRFDSSVIPLQQMTSRLNDLHNAIRTLDYIGGGTGAASNGTLLYDAITTVSKSVISKDVGRRALVVLTDGEDNGSHVSLADTIREAQIAGVAVYAVLYTQEMIGGRRYPNSPATRRSGIDVMEGISKATGGRAFIAGGKASIAQIFEEIEQDLRSQYRFGFTPPPSKPGKFNPIELRTGDKHEIIQARSGYYTPE